MQKSFAETRDFLGRHTKVIELTGADGAAALVCPDYQGRIMTSTCGGPNGASLGWVNYDFITAGKHVPAFNNYGGEDRFWLGPEGGQFGLFFQLGLNQTVDNWYTPPAINTGAFAVDGSDAASCRLSRRVRVTNVAEGTFDLDVLRELRMLGLDRFAALVSKEAADAARQGKARYVGFESVNTATNLSPMAWNMKKGLVAIWTLGQFPSGDQTAIVIPYKPGTEKDLGRVVQSDYFGAVPPERLKVTPAAVLFRGDGQFRGKLGISPARVRPIAGSIDFRAGVLTLVQFSLPDDPPQQFYVDNTWRVPQDKPFAGDVFNSYNDGPPEPGAKALGGFYELETLCPTRPLAQGERLMHTHRTFHFQAKPAVLAKLAKETLGVDLDEVRKFLGK
ncbi:MAG: hypothetical protein HYX69_00105 [Planctomycetia bacterium]|nr:hypothetical protein [Planctomycetia bacterium]